MLAEMPEVQDLHPVSDAHVPIMKFKYNGISIDLLYANVAMWSIPEVCNYYLVYHSFPLIIEFLLVFLVVNIIYFAASQKKWSMATDAKTVTFLTLAS